MPEGARLVCNKREGVEIRHFALSRAPLAVIFWSSSFQAALALSCLRSIHTATHTHTTSTSTTMSVTSAIGTLIQSVIDILTGILHSLFAILSGVWSVILGLLKAGLATVEGLLSVLWCKFTHSTSHAPPIWRALLRSSALFHSRCKLVMPRRQPSKQNENTDLTFWLVNIQLPLLLVLGFAILIYQIFVVDQGRKTQKVGAGRKKVA